MSNAILTRDDLVEAVMADTAFGTPLICADLGERDREEIAQAAVDAILMRVNARPEAEAHLVAICEVHFETEERTGFLQWRIGRPLAMVSVGVPENDAELIEGVDPVYLQPRAERPNG